MSKWIWYPGDFEIYHGKLQNFSREEREYSWPAGWKIDDCRKNIRFSRTYSLAKGGSFKVTGEGNGFVMVNRKKYAFEKEIFYGSGDVEIVICIGNPSGLPCVYIEGGEIYSDEGWLVSDYVNDPFPIGFSRLYMDKGISPNEVCYEKTSFFPVLETERNGGLLFDFGRELTAVIKLTKDAGKPVTLCYGETEGEALDVPLCYYKQSGVTADSIVGQRAFRYVFIPECKPGEWGIKAVHQNVPLEVKAEFSCDSDLLNNIWHTSAETLGLCSGLFFIDGVKRDRWIWSGDAYQCYLINPYIFYDKEINERTILALRGNLPVEQHINTILDYSLLWIISIYEHYCLFGEVSFLESIYPKMEATLKWCMNQTDENGFITGRKDDWIFVDWAEIDKNGSISAEQMLFIQSIKSVMSCGEALEKDVSGYKNHCDLLLANVIQYFWKEEKGAFIDSYLSGKNQVTRHANIWAIYFDLVDESKKSSIINNVMKNSVIRPITTPYFKFYELDVLCKTGDLDIAFQTLKNYWGGMLQYGTATFWEEYIPGQPPDEIQSMYGDPYGKSLCHAWGASPIYLLGKYFIGLQPKGIGYRLYELKPRLEYFQDLDCVLPLPGGNIHITYTNNLLKVKSSVAGGTLALEGHTYALKKDVEILVNCTSK